MACGVSRSASLGLLLVATIAGAAPLAAPGAADGPDITAVKGSMFFQFARFVEWPALADKAPIVMCVVGDRLISAALTAAAKGQTVGGHTADVRRPQDASSWRDCHLLFVGGGELQRSTAPLSAIRTLPVLTVSDGKAFASSGGIVELYVENGRMAFAINTDASDRAGLRLSSQLLRLARITRDSHAH